MTRLALLDTAFFALETPTRPMHAGVLMLFDPPAGEPGADFADRVVDTFRQTPPVAPFDRRPVFGPARLPSWATVEAVDLDYHVRRIVLPAPGSRNQLMELASHLYVALLDRSQPLWECYVIEGLVDAMLIDGIGATEGAMGVQVTRRGGPLAQTGQFLRLGETKLFSEDGREIAPGSDEAGLIAAGGKLIPKGYFKDAEKSAKVLRVIDGQRYAFIGDWGRLEADGSLVLLGRGSGCINTAGEKVYPEEVEEAIKTHPDVADALVVGVPDERFGQRVTAVVAPDTSGSDVVDALGEYLRTRLAGYKCPRLIVQVEAIKRAPNGKPDYAWAREAVLGAEVRA